MASLRVEEGLINQILDILHHLFLPALTLFLINLGLMTRITRTGMLEALRSEYIVAARSKGLLERTILFKHALKNSMLPILTIIGLQIGWMLAGAVLVETVFAWPGLGRLLYSSVGARDYPVVMGIFLLIALAVVLSNFIVDILYSVLDPRVRRG
jgi:peptide/nickel transport system permease protein